MSWQDTLQDASFRGAGFLCTQVSRSGVRAIAVHELPYQAGADLEDLNLGVRRIRLRAVFYGDDYEVALADFISALEAPGTGELIHPIHGSMTVLAEAWDDDHDADYVDTAVVSVSFIEDAVREMVFSDTSAAAKTDAIVSGARDARLAADDGLASYVAAVPDDPVRFEVMDDAFAQAQDFIGQLLSVTGSSGLLLSGLVPRLYPRAYAGDQLAALERAFEGLPFGGRNEAYGTGFPAAFTSTSVGNAARSGQSDFQTLRSRLNPAALVITPARPVLTTIQSADVAVIQAHARVYAAAAIAEATAIVLAGELDVALLNRNDIEQLAGQARAGVQVAIDSARGSLDPEARGVVSTALSTLAWKVQEAARAVINQRPPLIRRPAPVSGPLRLVAHAIYGESARADELASLNALGRYVLIDKGSMLYAYSR